MDLWLAPSNATRSTALDAIQKGWSPFGAGTTTTLGAYLVNNGNNVFLMSSPNNNDTSNGATGCTGYANFSYDIVILVVCVVCLLVGLVYSFYGYRLFKIVLFLTGFQFGSVLIYMLCEKEQLLPTLGNVGVGIGAGLLFGLITALVQYVGLFMTGFLTGLLAGTLVLTVWSAVVQPADTLWVTIGLLFCSGILLAVLTLKFQRFMVITGSALIGGSLICVSFDYFVEKFSTAYRFWDALNVRRTYWSDLCWFSWLIVLVWPLVFFLGSLVQWKLTSVGFDHKAGWPHFRRRRAATAASMIPTRTTQQASNPASGRGDHSRREIVPHQTVVVPSNNNPGPKKVDTKSFRYLYQARRTHGDVICQNYIDSMQKLAQTQVMVKTTPTMTSDYTQLTILTNNSSRSDSNNGSV